MFIGNTFVYVQFRGLDSIDATTRMTVVIVLASIASLGMIVIILLPKARPEEGMEEAVQGRGPVRALKDAGHLFMTKHMLLLCTTFFYTGKR